MRFRGQNVLLGLVALLAGGAALQPLKRGLVPSASAQDLLSLVGGYRTFAADCLWLETNLAWENRDALRVRRLIHFTVKADPHSPYFWLNGARVMAYDFPAWQGQLDTLAPLTMQAHWKAMGAEEALRLLERGQQWHGKSAILHLEMAHICLNALGDRSRAAEHYRLAAEQADAPEYATRIYARLRDKEIPGMTLTR